LCGEVVDLESLRAWMSGRLEELDENPAAWCAIELAILDLLAKERGEPLEALLRLSPLNGRFRYSAVLGDSNASVFEATIARFRALGFSDIKVKLSGEEQRDRRKVAVLRQYDGQGIRVRVDANNFWKAARETIGFLRDLDYPFFAVEEPVRPSDYVALASIGEALGCRIILDESFLRLSQLDRLRAQPDRWLINLRVSKMGGLTRSLAVVDAARAIGVGLIIGAQVGETSLLTRAALTVAHAAGPSVVAQEGAFGTFLLERDVCDPPLMFGKGGVLDVASYPSLSAAPGCGLPGLSTPGPMTPGL
jgi:L-alanine-DL-glutamate epimerase-like enolase superfamily enzyme